MRAVGIAIWLNHADKRLSQEDRVYRGDEFDSGIYFHDIAAGPKAKSLSQRRTDRFPQLFEIIDDKNADR